VAYYVIRVAPRQEEVFLRLSRRLIEADGVSVLFPRRKMEHLKGGKRVAAEVALFPGYVFLRSDEGLSPALYTKIKAIPKFALFVKQGDAIAEVRGRDLDLLSHFLKFGEVTPQSLVTFDENQRIKVLSGPMEGLEGQIVHVDRRKRRAKIQLDFDHGTFTVTLGFELIGEPLEGTA
jgi:transcription termination/antitermination protein NusG